MSSDITVNCLTIGQSPRPDILDEMMRLLPQNSRMHLKERGILDGLSEAELHAAIVPGGESFYVTLLRDGTRVKISTLILERLLHETLETLEPYKGDLAVLLCTGEFPHMESAIPFFRGSEIIKKHVSRVYRGKKIAIVVPDAGQNNSFSQRWEAIGIKHTMYNCLPYSETIQSRKLCAELRESDVDFIVLDCIGFTVNMANCFRKQTGKRVLLPREMICEFLGTVNNSSQKGNSE